MVMRWIALVRGTDRREIPAVHVSRHPCPENGAGCRNGDYTSGCCIAGIRIISGGLPDFTFPALSSGRNTTSTSQGRGQRFINFLTGVNPAAVQPVLVTNWPTGGLSGTGATDTSSGGRQGRGRRKRGPGRGRPVTPPCHRPQCHRLPLLVGQGSGGA